MIDKPLYPLAEIKVLYESHIQFSQENIITTSHDAEKIFRKAWSDDIEYKESFAALYLNRGNRVLGLHWHSRGGVAGTIVDGKQILGIALKSNASSIILCHNHPSGNRTPSEADKHLTEKLRKACAFMDLKLLDHIILIKDGFLSFVDEGLL